MIAPLAASDVREARQLTRLLDRLIRESGSGEGRTLLTRALGLAFTWALPASAPLLAWRGDPALAFVVLFVGVFVPAAFRSSTRTEHDEGTRLYGPPGRAFWIARLSQQAPWLAWASLAAALVPMALALRAGTSPDAFTFLLSLLMAAFPFVRLTLGAGADRARSLRKPLESLATVVFAATLATVFSRWEPSAAVARELWILVAVALAWTTLACGSRLQRRLAPEADTLTDDEEAEDEGRRRPVDMGLPGSHAGARSPIAIELTLARLSLEHRMRAAPGPLSSALILLACIVGLLFPVLVGLLGVLLLGEADPPRYDVTVTESGGVLGRPLEPRVSLIALWIATLLLGASRERSNEDWVRGMDWRTQLGLDRLRWLALSFLPAALGGAVGLALGGVHPESMAALALVLAGSLLRGGLGGLGRLLWAPRGEGTASRLGDRLAPVGLAVFFFGFPLAHLFDVEVGATAAMWIAAGFAAFAVLGLGADLVLRTEEDVAREVFREESDPDDDDEFE